MRRLPRSPNLALTLIATVLLGACAVQELQMDAPAPTLFTTERIGMKVGVYIPPETRSLTHIKALPTPCIGPDMTSSPVGETFAKIVVGHLAPLFESVTPIASPAEAARYDAMLEARLDDFGNRFGCPISPGDYFQTNGSMQAVDGSGQTIWRSSTNARRHNRPIIMTLAEIESVLGREASKALAALVEGWTQELVRAPVFAEKRAGPAGTRQAELVFWDSIKTSTNPGDYRAYLETYPRGQFAALARVRAGLAAGEAPAPSAAPAPPRSQPPPVAAAPPRPAAPLPAPSPAPAPPPTPAAAETVSLVGEALAPPPPRPPVGPEQFRNERRVALVIGNGAYASLAAVRPAVGDARAVAAALRHLGFQVEAIENANYLAMNRAIGAFGERIGRGGVGFFFYSGHALQLDGENFLVPVDARLQSNDDVSYQGINLGFVATQFAKIEARAGVLALDAARANPNPARLRAVGSGLLAIDAPPRTLYLAAADPGQTAVETGEGRGLLTEALLHVIDEPGVPLPSLLARIPAAVQQRSGGRQRAWINDAGLPQNFYLRPGASQ